MLSADEVDLESLILARNDADPDGDWWFDPRTGESLYLGVDDDTDLVVLAGGVHVLIPRDPQPRTDIEEFFAIAEDLGVPERTVADLWQTFRGKGGLRRFRERVGRTAAASAYGDYAFRREAARALRWLDGRALIEPDSARRLLDSFDA